MLTFHEYTAWLGALLILIHAGIHFNAALPWIATAAMFINVASGLVGKYLLTQSRKHVQGERADLLARGLTTEEVDQKLFWDSVMVNTMAKWRKVHIPIFIAFAALSLGHIISVFFFWSWK